MFGGMAETPCSSPGSAMLLRWIALNETESDRGELVPRKSKTPAPFDARFEPVAGGGYRRIGEGRKWHMVRPRPRTFDRG